MVDAGYRPIGDYVIIGDAHTAALVARDGSIDWCCWPHFDSPAVFCRLLDARKGGWFRVGPVGGHDVTRSYISQTNVLRTTFTTGTGRLRVTDFMPQAGAMARLGKDVDSGHHLLKLVEGLAGEVELEIVFRPTFDFARAATSLLAHPNGAVARAGRESISLSYPMALRSDTSGALVGRTRVQAGNRLWIALTYQAEGDPGVVRLSTEAADAALARTLDYWQRWSGACTYDGPYHDRVRRSALTLKLLTFGPTGALVAAPTTSLPEAIGGSRNWDYRYAWLRDSALVVYALMTIGYHDEAKAFFDWIERTAHASSGDLQIVYRVDGSRNLPEQALDHLEGYRGSRPVRLGNAAAEQMQIDMYGEVLDAAYLCYTELSRPIDARFAAILRRLADRAAARWQEPDHGIWEMRKGRKQFLYAKLLCWVALDRAVRFAERSLLTGDVRRWRRAREDIRRAILARGYNHELGAFTQSFDASPLDASALALPLVGFLPPSDPRVRSTVDRIRERLTVNGLVYRYLTDDGLPSGEAAFALCSFWLVDNLALDGRVDEARTVFERLVGYTNDVGLLAEEIAPSTGDLLGNFPQGFTHLALIRSALTIAKAEAEGWERRRETHAQREGKSERAIRTAGAPRSFDSAI